jgi:hypothetical protein
MNTIKVSPILVLMVALNTSYVSSQSVGQNLDFPEYTTQERWDRASLHVTLLFALSLHKDLEAGKTPEEHAQSVVSIIGPGWSGVTSPEVMARAMHRNWLIWPGAEFVAEEADGSVRIRANRPWRHVFDETGRFFGVSLDDFNKVFRIFHELIARQQGMEYHQTEDVDVVRITISKR